MAEQTTFNPHVQGQDEPSCHVPHATVFALQNLDQQWHANCCVDIGGMSSEPKDPITTARSDPRGVPVMLESMLRWRKTAFLKKHITRTFSRGPAEEMETHVTLQPRSGVLYPDETHVFVIRKDEAPSTV
jgi:hypothetical protein